MPSFLGQWGDTLDHFAHLLVAFVLALPIGWHRAREEQSAGLRTFPLVAIASCALVQTAISVFGADATVNANILQGVVTGIGFIGAGAIIRQGDFTMGHATAARRLGRSLRARRRRPFSPPPKSMAARTSTSSVTSAISRCSSSPRRG